MADYLVPGLCFCYKASKIAYSMPPQRSVCTQWQIRYTCGHSQNSEFVKCAKHDAKEDQRCSLAVVEYKEAKASGHSVETAWRVGRILENHRVQFLEMEFKELSSGYLHKLSGW